MSMEDTRRSETVVKTNLDLMFVTYIKNIEVDVSGR